MASTYAYPLIRTYLLTQEHSAMNVISLQRSDMALLTDSWTCLTVRHISDLSKQIPYYIHQAFYHLNTVCKTFKEIEMFTDNNSPLLQNTILERQQHIVEPLTVFYVISYIQFLPPTLINSVRIFSYSLIFFVNIQIRHAI